MTSIHYPARDPAARRIARRGSGRCGLMLLAQFLAVGIVVARVVKAFRFCTAVPVGEELLRPASCENAGWVTDATADLHGT